MDWTRKVNPVTAPIWARSVGSCKGLENSRFSDQPVAVATQIV